MLAASFCCVISSLWRPVLYLHEDSLDNTIIITCFLKSMNFGLLPWNIVDTVFLTAKRKTNN